MATAFPAFDRFDRQARFSHADCWPEPVDSCEDSETSDAAVTKNAPAKVFCEVAALLGPVLAFVAATEILLDVLHIPA
jgi:hypothetical protein